MEHLKPLEHKFKALFFKTLSPLLEKGRANFSSIDGAKISKVLFLRPEKIGDMVISLPVFDGLHQSFPDIRISILGSPKNLPLIKDDPRFDKIFLYRKSIWKDPATMLRIRKEKFDCVIDMICDDSVTALFMSQFLAPGKPRIGVGKNKFRQYYDFNYDHRMNNTGHIIDNTLKLLNAFNINLSDISEFAPPFLSDKSKSKSSEFFNDLAGFGLTELRVGINISAGSPTRVWQQTKFVALVNSILKSSPKAQIIIFSMPDERGRAAEIISQCDSKVFLIPGGLSLEDVSAIISKLDVLITPDTSLVHIARAFKVQVVGLYTRFMKNFLLWKPFGQENGTVVSDNDDNIHDITHQQVYAEFRKVSELKQAVGP
ncbi:MAG: glycosyltransferase family 9 protein [candidate division Zixibacteria bacterium]|nr:glycosyltransferase family 9 protein [candidate division Zixibacteria bacterium]